MVPPALKVHRFHELDSLRGLAAATVVLCHFRLMWTPTLGRAPGWLALLYPISGGREAVMLFFMLSGFVLSMPYLQGKGQPYPVYLARRALRIYLPYLAALALAVAGDAIWHGGLGRNVWGDLTWLLPPDVQSVVDHVVFLGSYDWSQYNTAFWSLVIEMRISLVFPLLYRWLRRTKALSGLAIAGAFSLGAAALVLHWPRLDNMLWTVQYAAFFMSGILLAIRVDRVKTWYGSLSGASRSLFGTGSVLLYVGGRQAVGDFGRGWGLDHMLTALGAAGFMTMAISDRRVRGLLQARVPRFLGRISYSLYLVHGTVLFAVTRHFEGHAGMLAQFAIYLPVSVALAYGFCIAVEEPCMRLGRRVGAREIVVIVPLVELELAS